MGDAEKLERLNASLERCAEKIGDITPVAIATYYRAFPQARARFDTLSPNGRHQLEGQMVMQVLYCAMEWFSSPGEIEVILMTTVPHHIRTLEVAMELFSGLVTAVCDTVAGTIPPEMAEERAVWAELRAVLTGLIGQEAAFCA